MKMFFKKKKKTVNILIAFLCAYINGSFIKKYVSSSEAERANGITQSKVGECCRGKRKTAGGFIWKYDIKD
jgi:hypothetical protein